MAQAFNVKLNNKISIIQILGAIILLFIVIAISILAFRQSQVPETVNVTDPQVVNVDPKSVSVQRVIPSAPLPLTPGLPYSFTVYFKERVSIRNVYFTLTANSVYGDAQAAPVKITTTQTNEKTFVIKTDEPIKTYGEYILRVFNRQNGQVIFTKGYMTKDFVPTPVPLNNKELVPFLPHETDSYILEFVPEKNIYIFHFKYNPDLPTTAEAQFNSAQTDAKRFIQNAGIDVNSIVIEWRNS